MSYVDELLPQVLPAAPGCLDITARRAIRTSAMEFYRDSEAWRYTTEGSAVIEGLKEVDLSLPAGTSLARVYWARLGNKDLKGVSERWIARDDQRGEPSEFAVVSGSRRLLVYPMPNQTNAVPGIVAHVALVPGLETDDINTELLSRHRMAIVYGAIRTLLATPGSPWTDVNLAMQYAGMYEQEKMMAKRIAQADQAPIARTVRYGGI